MASLTLVLMGVSGAGKSSVMAALVERSHLLSAEGDAFHSAENIRQMQAGIPLTDADRSPWLESIAAWIGARERDSADAVITCSALRRRYRDVLREGHPSVCFVHLTTAASVIEQRLTTRTGHLMPPSLLASQFAVLEPLEADEPGFELAAADRTPSQLAIEILERIERGDL